MPRLPRRRLAAALAWPALRPALAAAALAQPILAAAALAQPILAAAALARPALAQSPPRPPLTVGPGRQFATLAAAIAAAAEGDLLLIAAGRYQDDTAHLTKRLTLRAEGGLAELVATMPPPNGKAILVIGADATLEGIAFSGARVANLNGAGIRYEGGHLLLRRCRFEDNQMNLLAAPDPAGSLTVERCAFGPTAAIPFNESLSHGLYANRVGRLRLHDSLFHGVASGHQVKSRAIETIITGCRIGDGEGQGSYAIDLPNGGRALIEDNVIEQGPNTDHPAIIHFGGEGPPYADSALRIAGNLVVNRYDRPDAVLLRNQTGTRAVLEGNRVFGLGPGQMASGPATVRGTEILATAPAFDTAPP